MDSSPTLQKTTFRPTDTDAPADAFRCSLSTQLTVTPEDDDGNVPVTLVARTAGVIDHWYWGRIVHDLSGFQSKDRIPIDYNHSYDDSIGYLDSFEADENRLLVSGALVPMQDDAASKIAYKARRGVPYEASIDWNGPAVLEYLDDGQSVEVNGRTFAGPGVVARKWTLAAVAITPHGADPATATMVHNSDKRTSIKVCTMSEPKVSPAAEVPEADATISVDLARRVQEELGPEALSWLLDGATYEECQKRYRDVENSKLAAELSTLEETVKRQASEIEQLQQQLQAAKALAETSPPIPVGATETEKHKPSFEDLFANVK